MEFKTGRPWGAMSCASDCPNCLGGECTNKFKKAGWRVDLVGSLDRVILTKNRDGRGVERWRWSQWFEGQGEDEGWSPAFTRAKAVRKQSLQSSSYQDFVSGSGGFATKVIEAMAQMARGNDELSEFVDAVEESKR